MVEARQYRGDCVESVHPFSAVAVEGARVVFAVGDDRETAFRSACKPMQLAVSLELLDDPEDLSAAHLAVGCASHSAEPRHLTLVRAILERFHRSPDELLCGAHAPLHGPSAEAVLRAGGAFSSLHNNCSGKHAFMLAACARAGWPLDYRPMNHPLQQKIHGRMAEWMAFTPRTVVDGCGVPTFVQPLSRVARAWAEMARAMGARSEAPWMSRLARCGWAMAQHPELTSGTGRLDLSIARGASEPIAVKIGAMGLFCVALPRRALGLAVKVHSGSSDALAVAVEWALEQVAPGVFSREPRWELALVRNVVGLEVGCWEVSTDRGSRPG